MERYGRLDPTMLIEDAAMCVEELLNDIHDGRVWSYSDDAAWSVQGAAVELMASIRRLREEAAGIRPEKEYRSAAE